MTNLETALQYRARGWSIIPIRPKTKMPAISSWIKYQTQIASPAEIKAWLMMDPDMGWALICGKVSGIIAVDVDSGKGEVDIIGLYMPPTLAQKTGTGGYHYLYKWREGLVGAKVGIRKGIDIRSDNSYIVIAPSIHPNGTQYEWMVDEDTPVEEAPDWLNDENKIKEKADWNKILTTSTEKGLRNMTATKMAGKILYEISPELWDTMGIGFFHQWNNDFNNPSLNDDELLIIWESIKKTHIRNNPQALPEEEKSMDDMSPQEKEVEIRKLFLKNKTLGTYELARYMVQKYNIITVGEREREMFIYKDGMYYPGADNLIIYPEIQRIIGNAVNKSAKMETFHKIADMTSFSRDVFTLTPTNLIPMKNGVFDFEKRELLPHSPQYRFTYQFPIMFEPSAECPKTSIFMDQILNEQQRVIVEEWIGFYFWRNYMFKKAIIFVGEGDTGKTTLLEVITYLLGRENISSISLQKMTSDKFSAAHLYEKHGNLVDELSAKDISDTGAFKMATGGGSVTGEYKFGNQFSFHNFSKFTFACNRIPDVSDTNDLAFFNRWIPVRFEKTIEKKIPNFIDTLRTDEERSGLFNLGMKGLRRLLDQGKFTYGNNADEIKVEMMRSGSSIAMFASDMLERDNGAEISKEDMYDYYVMYCQEKNLSTQTKDALGKRLSNYAVFISEGLIDSFNNKGRPDRVRGWRNVKIRGVEDVNKQAFDTF